MKVFHSLDQIRGMVVNPVVTVGSYDGVHSGHRRILAELERIAAEEGGESVVVTFDPHPRTVIRNGGKPVCFLNTLDEKIYLLGSAGVNNLLVINFTPGFAELSSGEFARQYLFEGIGAKALIIGYNHQFGHNREGGMDYLGSLRKEYGFRLVQIPEVGVEESKVSSTVVRKLINIGDMETANKYLCAPYLIMGVPGECGEIKTNPDKALPPAGEYPAEIRYGTESFPGRLGISHDRRLTLHSQYPGILSGKEITVFFT